METHFNLITPRMFHENFDEIADVLMAEDIDDKKRKVIKELERRPGGIPEEEEATKGQA